VFSGDGLVGDGQLPRCILSILVVFEGRCQKEKEKKKKKKRLTFSCCSPEEIQLPGPEPELPACDTVRLRTKKLG